MSIENKPTNRNDVLAKLHQARALVDECIAEMGKNPGSQSKAIPAVSKRPRAQHQASQARQQLSFDLNPRAFMKKYGRSSSGTQKFVLLLARLAEGKVGREVQFSEIRRQWNKMKSIMDGKFNAAYGNRAKDNGWVDTAKYGVHVLTPEWREALI